MARHASRKHASVVVILICILLRQWWFGFWWILSSSSSPSNDDDDDTIFITNNNHHHKQQHQSRVVERIVLLGERHSGTTFFTNHLIDCFPHIHVGNVLTSNKHWLQRNRTYIRSVYERYGKQAMPQWSIVHGGQHVPDWIEIATTSNNYDDDDDNEPQHFFQNTLVIAMTRNPYDWMEAMRRIPHHWPNHVDSCHHYQNQPRPLPWREFIRRPLYLVEEMRHDNNTTLCQKGYLPNTISPCTRTEKYRLPPCTNNKIYTKNKSNRITTFASVNDPVYELREDSGLPYDNIMQFRAAKLHNLLSVPQMWKLYGFLLVQYEDLVQHGTQFIIPNISLIMNDSIPPKCRFLPPRKEKRSQSQSKYSMDNEWKQWIQQHADWEVEAKVGYQKNS